MLAGGAVAGLAALTAGGLMEGALDRKALGADEVHYAALRRSQSVRQMEPELGQHEDGTQQKMPALHPGLIRMQAGESYRLMHPVYKKEDLNGACVRRHRRASARAWRTSTRARPPV